MFRLFRKLGTAPSSSGTTPQQQTVPSPEPGPPPTPSPPPLHPLTTDPNPLYTLIASVPPQTFHAYTLAHLIPPTQPLSPLSFPHIPLPSEPPSPSILTALTAFFSTLVPPPSLHCVRCHKSYFEVENSDRSCLVPHDDESAEVERVGVTGRVKGVGTEYETLWGCCGKSVEGDGDMGPPDGWCYEGKHTTDLKRARFRADSTPHDDKLTSCERLRCHEPTSSPRSTRGGGTNKRRRALMEGAEGEDTQSSIDGSTASGVSSNNMSVDDTTTARKPKRARHSKSVSISSKAGHNKETKDKDTAMMDIDLPSESKSQSQPQAPATPKSPPRSRKPRKSTGASTTPGAKTKPKAKSPLGSSFSPPSPPDDNGTVEKEKLVPLLPRPIVEIRTERDGSPLLSTSTSTTDLRHRRSNSSLKEKPKSRARRNTVTEANDPTPKPPKPDSNVVANSTTMPPSTTVKPKSSSTSLKPKSSSGALKTKSSAASLRSTTNAKPPSTLSNVTGSQRSPKKAGGRKRGKALNEVVSTSVDGEENI